MTNNEDDKKKQVIGLYGEMQLAMILHEKGWQVHRAYIDEGIDFIITKYFCKECNKYTNQYIRNKEYKGIIKKCVTNLCEKCKTNNISVVSKYLQVKTSEGKLDKKQKDVRIFSFHPKIRYNVKKDMFYVWIAIFPKEFLKQEDNTLIHFYIFKTNDVSKFDDIELASYQITDNQKTSLRINKKGEVLNKGKKHNYNSFKNFHNNFNCLNNFL